MSRTIPLETKVAQAVGIAKVVPTSELSTEERIQLMEQQISHIATMLAHIKSVIKEGHEDAYQHVHVEGPVNKDNLPIGLVCYGITGKQIFPFCLTITEDGLYTTAGTKFPSLSKAAEAVSGVRRSGWAFWKLPDGRSLKEAFKR